MNNDVIMKLFEHEKFGKMRATTIDGEVWFVGKDIAVALGYSNPRKALLDHVDEEDKLQGDGVTIRDSIGREQKPTIINESGLYALIFSSKLPAARQFKHWVTHEVLPSIRKDGQYVHGCNQQRLVDDDLLYSQSLVDDLLGQIQMLVEANTDSLSKLGMYARTVKNQTEKIVCLTQENARLKKESAAQAQVQLINQNVYYTYVNTTCPMTTNITEIARDYGQNGIWLNQKLAEYGVHKKENGTWVLVSEYASREYTVERINRDGSAFHYWTREGRLMIYELLKEHGIVPLMEQVA